MVRSNLAAEAYSVSEAVEEAQWLRSVPGRNVAFCSELSPTILEDSGGGLPAQTDCDTLRFLQSLPSCVIRQGVLDQTSGSESIVSAMLREVFCEAQEATLAFVTTATMLADHCLWLLAGMNARRHVFVTCDSSTGVKTTLPMPSEPVPTLKMANGSQLIRSAESHSGRSRPGTG